MRKTRSSITAHTARQLLRYDPETGLLTWLRRSPEMFCDGPVHPKERKCAEWNRRYAGKVAGAPKPNGDYWQISIFDERYLVHRIAYLIVTGEWPPSDIDHINMDRADNRWRNLRPATPSQNLANVPMRSNNTSGHRGVTWSKTAKKWVAQIGSRGRYKNLGYYHKLEDAAAAYRRAALSIYGEFARTSDCPSPVKIGEGAR